MKTLILVFTFCFLLFSSILNAENYAVLITGDTPVLPATSPKTWNGGSNGKVAYDEFWNDTYLMWEILWQYGFKDENIFVLYGYGIDYSSAGDRYNVLIQHQGSGITEITDYPANRQDVMNIFNWLKNGNSSQGVPQMTSDDFLFVWVFDHGSSYGSNGSLFYVMDGAINDYALANATNSINYDKRVFWMQQCHSGGFIDDLENSNTIIFTSCQWNQSAYRADNINPDGADLLENEYTSGAYYHHGEFNYHVFNAAMLETII